MALTKDVFDQSSHLQFKQSTHLMRVINLPVLIELRSADYAKSHSGAFRPIFDDDGAGLTGKALDLNTRRRFLVRTVNGSKRVVGWEQDLNDPNITLSTWDAQESYTTTDTLAETSLVPTTTGGNTIVDNNNPYPRTLSVTHTSNFEDGEDGKLGGMWDDESGAIPYGYVEMTRTSTSSTSLAWTRHHLAEYPRIDDSIYIRDEIFWDYSEERSGEILFDDELESMETALLQADVFDTLWGTPPSGALEYHYDLAFDQFPGEQNPPNWGTAFDPALWDTDFTGNTENAYSYAANQTPAERASIEFEWGTFWPTSTTRQGVATRGSRVQWRADQAVDYCVIEFIESACVIHTEIAHASALQIVEMPMGDVSGWGVISYGEGEQALGVSSTVRTYFGKTATQVLRDLEAVGLVYVPITL